MKWIAAAITALSLATIPVAHAQENPAEKDVYGRPVPVGTGRPSLVFYANRDTREGLRRTAFPFAYELRGERPVIVVHVDISDVPGLFRGTAKSEIKKSQRECLDEMAQMFKDNGQQPPAWLGDSLYMIADSDGQPHRALGLQQHFKQPFAMALAGDGSELARGPFPQSSRVIERAIEEHAPTQQASLR